jgi:hypothetical protein
MGERKMYETIEIKGQTYVLRYPGLIQIDIERNAGKFFGIPNRKFGAADLMQQLGYAEVQAYLLWQGLKGGSVELRKMKFEDAVQLRDDFLTVGDLDAGEKMTALQEALALALTESMGIDGKKLKMKTENRTVEGARTSSEPNGTGTEPGEMPLESSD